MISVTKIYSALTAEELRGFSEQFGGSLFGVFAKDVRSAKAAYDCVRTYTPVEEAEAIRYGTLVVEQNADRVQDGRAFWCEESGNRYCFFVPAGKASNARAYRAWLAGESIVDEEKYEFVLHQTKDPCFYTHDYACTSDEFYVPFEKAEEVFAAVGAEPYACPVYLRCRGDGAVSLVQAFKDGRAMVDGVYEDMANLFDLYTFASGKPFGKKK